jgi:hypothetical protein
MGVSVVSSQLDLDASQRCGCVSVAISFLAFVLLHWRRGGSRIEVHCRKCKEITCEKKSKKEKEYQRETPKCQKV